MKRIRMFALAGITVLALGACTPQEWIKAHFGTRSGEATRVAMCESSLNPRAVSPGGGNHGLFQINNVHQANFTRVTGQPWSSVYNPHYNSMYARYLYNQSGWRPWTCQP
jgi:Lysozyme like domain